MRLPRVRSTVRRLLAVVAVVAVLLGSAVEIVRLNRRTERCRALASYCASMEREYAGLASRLRARGHRMAWYAESQKALFGRLRREHEEAATRPWRAMPDDPPAPPTVWGS